MIAFLKVWRGVAEPKVVTLISFFVYVGAAAGSIWTFTEPSLTLLGELGPIITRVLAVLIFLGALMASAAALPGYWALERVGVAFMILGLAGYFGVVIYMHATSEGSRAQQLTGLFVGIGLLAAQLARIWSKDWAPSKARIT
ncbi:MAG: hypothetical protein P0Y60_14435 [Candidatus Microbacterium colombiense]|nr:MAG: hypothetical protein P0Y60_14435 [Microbacterium sp.]